MKVTRDMIRKYRALLKKKVATAKESTLLDCITKIIEAGNAIYRHDGKAGWSKEMPELEGIDEKEFQPLVDFLLELRSGTAQHSETQSETQSGGDMSMDGLFEKVMDASKYIGTNVNNYVNQYGPTLLSSKKLADSQTDLKPLAALPAVPFLEWTGAVPLPGYAISDLPMSPVLIYRTGMLSLDIMLLMLNYIAPQSYFRPFLSTVLVSMELLDGRWKAALVSAAGIFSSKLIAPGFLMKMGLSIFDLMPPSLQEEVSWVTYRSIKSIVVGFAVELFLMVAPAELRNKVRDILGKVAMIEIDRNKLLVEANLPEKDVQSTSYATSSVLGVMANNTLVCSSELQKLVPVINESILLEFIAQLVGLPTTEGMINEMCGKLYREAIKQEFNTLGHLLAAEGLEKLLVERVTQATATGAKEAAAKTGAATEEAEDPVEEAAEEDPAAAKAAEAVAKAAEAAPAATPVTTVVNPVAPAVRVATTTGGRRLLRGPLAKP